MAMAMAMGKLLWVFPAFRICLNRLSAHKRRCAGLSFTIHLFSQQANPKQWFSLPSELFLLYGKKSPVFRENSHKKRRFSHLNDLFAWFQRNSLFKREKGRKNEITVFQERKIPGFQGIAGIEKLKA
jgi:hypothetical protein